MENEAPNPTLGTEFLATWRAMQPADQGRHWRWGRVDRAALEASLERAIAALEIDLTPAGTASIRAAYDMLANAYAPKGGDDPAKRMRLWVVTFQDWPHCALQAAVQAWATKDTAFMPSPGQFHAVGAPVIERKRADLQDMRRIVRVLHDREPEYERFEPDPEITQKLARLGLAMRRGEDLAKLRKEGQI